MTTEPTQPKWWRKFTLDAVGGTIAGIARELGAWTLRRLFDS